MDFSRFLSDFPVLFKADVIFKDFSRNPSKFKYFQACANPELKSSRIFPYLQNLKADNAPHIKIIMCEQQRLWRNSTETWPVCIMVLTLASHIWIITLLREVVHF